MYSSWYILGPIEDFHHELETYILKNFRKYLHYQICYVMIICFIKCILGQFISKCLGWFIFSELNIKIYFAIDLVLQPRQNLHFRFIEVLCKAVDNAMTVTVNFIYLKILFFRNSLFFDSLFLDIIVNREDIEIIF